MNINNLKHPLAAAAAAVLVALAAVIPARADYTSTIQSFNPVAYWQLNENIPVPIDTATNSGTAGATANGPYSTVGVVHPVPGALAGSTDTAAEFDGSGSIKIPYNAAINPDLPFSVECWALSAAAAGDNHVLIQSMIQGENPDNANDRTGWSLREVGADLQMVVGTTNGVPYYYYFTASGVVVAGVWQHIVMVYDETGPSLYIDGVKATLVLTRQDGLPLEDPQPPIPFLVNFAGQTIIGDRGYGGWMFVGSLDEVAIYGSALSEAEVLAHYQNGINPAPATAYDELVQALNPVGYWRLNEPAWVSPPLPVAVNSGSYGNAADGTYYSGAVNGAPGVPYNGFAADNSACQFNGSDASYVEIPGMSLYSDSVTITCWAKRNGVSQYWAMLFSAPTDPGQPVGINSAPVTGIGFGDGGNPGGAHNDLRLYWSGDLGNTGGYGATPNPALFMPDQQWTFLALVASPTNLVLYMNGKSATNNAARGFHDFSLTESYIGKKQKYFGWDSGTELNGFVGTIDEVAIFDQALTRDQVMEIFAAAEVPPIILTQPVAPTFTTPLGPTTIYEGMTVPLFVAADEISTTSPLVYQWTKDGVPLPGQTATNLLLSPAATTDSGSYAVVITNAFGAVTSAVVAINVLAEAPSFFVAPQPAQRYAGGTATFTVVHGGSVPMSYQWNFNGTPIPGATAPTYTVAKVSTANWGNYSVQLSNAHGTLTSPDVALTEVSPTGYAAEMAAAGPAAYWRLNETSGTTAFDYFAGIDGVNNTAIALGSTDAPQAPLYVGLETTNTSYAFNSSAEVTLPATFDLNRGAFSIAAWIKVNVLQNYMCIMAKGGNAWRFHLNAGPYLEWVTSGTSGGTLLGTYDVTDGLWHHAVAVYDGAAKSIYVDGYLDVTVAATGLQSTVADPIRIGSQGGYRWYGNLDEVAVFNRGLTQEEVQNLYQIALAGPAAPTISTPPESRTVYAGRPVSFSVAAFGGAPYTYQWKRAGTDVPGATGSTLEFPSVSAADAGTYTVVVSNSAGSIESSPVTLAVLTLTPGMYDTSVFATQPTAYWRLGETVGATTALDSYGSFDGIISLYGATLEVEGPRPPAFPGFAADNTAYTFDGADTDSGQVRVPYNAALNTPQFTVSAWINPALDMTGDYRAPLSNLHYPGSRSGWLLYQRETGWNLQMYNQNPYNGGDPALDITGGGMAMPGTWYHVAAVFDGVYGHVYVNGVEVVSDKARAYIPNVDASLTMGTRSDGGQPWSGTLDEVSLYGRALTTDEIYELYARGAVSSGTAPAFLAQPGSKEVLLGGTLTLSAPATGSPPLAYQWKKDGNPLEGATGSTLTIPNATAADAGTYTLTVSNGAGTATCDPATVTVLPIPQYANLTNGLVLHLQFEDDFLDASGHANDGTAVGEPTFVPGKIGSKALYYNTDASDPNNLVYNYVTLGTPDDLAFGADVDFTLAYWVRMPVQRNPGWESRMPAFGNVGGGDWYGLWESGYSFGPVGMWQTWLWTLAPDVGYAFGTGYPDVSITDGNWHHLVHSFDRTGNGITYYDGVRVNSVDISGVGNLDTGYPVNIGQNGEGNFTPRNESELRSEAEIDDLGVWRVALTENEAKSIYIAGQAGRSFDEVAPLAVTLSVERVGTALQLNWSSGTLQSADDITGPWTPVTGASAPSFQVTPTAAKKFYRVQL